MKHLTLTRNSIMAGALWLSMLLAMFASMHHVASQFGWLESPGNEWFGWAAAIAIDAGILALAYGLRTRRKANRGRGAVIRLWFGVLFLTIISIAANLLSALSVRPDAIFQAVAFSATLPVIVILLSDVVSADDEKAARKADAADDKDREIKDLRRQLADAARQLTASTDNAGKLNAQVLELTATVADLTDTLSRQADTPAQPVIADRSKDGFMTHMRTGNGDRPTGVSYIVRQYNVSERTAQRWWSEWQAQQSGVPATSEQERLS